MNQKQQDIPRTANPQPQMKVSMVEAFKEFLYKIKETPRPSFDLNQFKTSNDDERKNCAKAMLDKAIARPENIVAYANLAKIIDCQYPSKFSNAAYPFRHHLSNYCDAVIEKLFTKGAIQSDDEIRKVGVFVSELHVRECIPNTAMRKWLEKVRPLVTQNKFGMIRSYLISLKITLSKMKQDDISSYQFYLQDIKKLALNGQIPDEFAQWSQATLGTSYPKRSPSVNSISSASSSTSRQT